MNEQLLKKLKTELEQLAAKWWSEGVGYPDARKKSKLYKISMLVADWAVLEGEPVSEIVRHLEHIDRTRNEVPTNLGDN